MEVWALLGDLYGRKLFYGFKEGLFAWEEMGNGKVTNVKGVLLALGLLWPIFR